MASEKAVEDAIKKHAIKNAIDYGKAKGGVVLAKVLAEFPEFKSRIDELRKRIDKDVKEVNSMKKEELENAYRKYEKLFEKIEKERAEKTAKPSFVLDGAVRGKFATRFAPEPNGYMQVGNAKAAFLAREFADIYDGGMALYFDDTNPEKESQEYADAIKSDLKWLGIRFDKEYYASDHIRELYKYAEQMLNNDAAYVCECEEGLIKKNRFRGIACEHRKNSVADNLKLWGTMLKDGFRDNGAVLRLKGDMKALNTVMRDPVLFRVIHHPHYRQGKKYVVWPTYNFGTPIVDSLEGITDAIRSKEYELRDELYYTILDLLRLRKARIRTIARLEFTNNITSKRRLRELVEKHLVWGWDDPRLLTIAGLRRRGVRAEAIRSFVLRFGMSKVNSEVDVSMLLDENRKLIDRDAKRLYFTANPVELVVEGAEKTTARLRLHPQTELGYREYGVAHKFFISGNDAKSLRKGDRVRLKDLFNVEIEKSGKSIVCRYIGNENIDAAKIQWVADGNYTRAVLFLPGQLMQDDEFNRDSMKKISGYVEKYAERLEKGEIIQFERVGFFKLDDKKQMSFIGL